MIKDELKNAESKMHTRQLVIQNFKIRFFYLKKKS